MSSNLYFKISDNLELRFENNQTNIYVNNELFRHCKYLLFNIAEDEVKNYKYIDSIDEAAEYLNKDNEAIKEISIPPHVEFWGHCSNLQAWVENDYDTRILHSNLAFPLLKKLSEYDSRAKIRFQEELVKRLDSDYEPVKLYVFNNYFKDLLSIPRENIENCNKLSIESIILQKEGLTQFPDFLFIIKDLRELYISNNNLTSLPESIKEFKKLILLNVYNNNLSSLPESIGEMKNLEYLSVGNNKLTTLPESILKLKKLKRLCLGGNELENPRELLEIKKELPTCQIII